MDRTGCSAKTHGLLFGLLLARSGWNPALHDPGKPYSRYGGTASTPSVVKIRSKEKTMCRCYSVRMND